jgi:hypothetical protein
VLYVSTQVSIRPVPTYQSSESALENSFGLGGIDRRASVTPSRRDPPRKQTRWSCLGFKAHPLIKAQKVRSGSSWEDVSCRATHVLPSWLRLNESSAVYTNPLAFVRWTSLFLMPVMASSYICR